MDELPRASKGLAGLKLLKNTPCQCEVRSGCALGRALGIKDYKKGAEAMTLSKVENPPAPTSLGSSAMHAKLLTSHFLEAMPGHLN